MNQMVKYGFTLAAICMAATLVLSVVYLMTKPTIEEKRRREEQEALRSVFAGADGFELKRLDGIDYFEARKEGRLVGYCLRATGKGYGGFITMIVGVDLAGAIEGVKIMEQAETPGLGTKIAEIKPGEKDPWFLRQFVGKPARTVSLRKDVQAITGATISSRAVTDAVRSTADKFFRMMLGRNPAAAQPVTSNP